MKQNIFEPPAKLPKIIIPTCYLFKACRDKLELESILPGLLKPGSWLTRRGDDSLLARSSFNSIMIALAFQLIFPCYLSAAVTNMSEYPIYVKPENGDTPIKVAPGETYKGGQDGIVLPSHKPGKVFKTVDNVDAVVDKDGHIHFSPNDIQGAIGQVVIGGWLDSPPSHPEGISEWEKSFEKANEVVKQQEQDGKIKPAAD